MKPKTVPSFKEEQLLWNKGLTYIAGVDEVGRGAFAGPLVAAAVILPKDFKINGIKDSKLLTPQKREELSKYIIKNALHYSITEIDVEFINTDGVGKATEKALVDCIEKLDKKYDFVLVDGYKLKSFDDNLQKGIIHGDSTSVSIAAASIIAKVYRDNLMRKLHNKYPQYNFLQNKGYGTKYHREALKKYGLSKIHRTSFNLQKFL
nr:ribonuclease HII [Candidatus Levybacteria bacterium]